MDAAVGRPRESSRSADTATCGPKRDIGDNPLASDTETATVFVAAYVRTDF